MNHLFNRGVIKMSTIKSIANITVECLCFFSDCWDTIKKIITSSTIIRLCFFLSCVLVIVGLTTELSLGVIIYLLIFFWAGYKILFDRLS